MNSHQINIQPFSEWNPAGDKQLLIAGPCSAESEMQVLTTAAQLVEHNVNIFRAGIWKPRSKPYTFRGCGEIGFSWLKKVKREFQFPIAVEVMSANELKIALDNEIDYIWLGARTTINPYMLDELAKALENTDIPVFIKNPISPDLDMLIGAIERINSAGIKKIAVIHRGFQSVYSAPYRNEPLWDIPIKLKCQYQDLPIICDPSHIAGDTQYIEEIIKKALTLEISGLMIEVHAHPSDALSDSKQQLSPQQFGKILQNVDFQNRRKRTSNNTPEKEAALMKINSQRQLIDIYDEQIIKLLAQRFEAVKEIGKIKKGVDIPALQSNRWNAVMKQCLSLGNEFGLSDEFVTNLMELIHKQSIDLQ